MPDAGIRRTLAQYCQHLDDGRYDEWAALFAHDARFQFGPEPEHVLLGREAIGAWVAPVMAAVAGRATRHLILNSLITMRGDLATSEADFVVLLSGRDGFTVSATGRYQDQFAQCSGTWLITEHVVTTR